MHTVSLSCALVVPNQRDRKHLEKILGEMWNFGFGLFWFGYAPSEEAGTWLNVEQVSANKSPTLVYDPASFCTPKQEHKK